MINSFANLTNLLTILLNSILFILPAYFANASPVIWAKLLGKHNLPIDFNKTWNGKPIFGQGKTWGGFVGGVLTGTFVGLLQSRLLAGFLLSFGALLGDLVGSFIKRRLGLARGQALPGLDQLGFVVFAVLFCALVEKPSIPMLITIFVLTPLAHFGTNVLAYILHLKKEWY
ncbi:MAG: CDP-2,3-bis-(O-geranylgeranyl)-sn-glycerol synthase [Candidatus Nanoarchaeia archaeon]